VPCWPPKGGVLCEAGETGITHCPEGNHGEAGEVAKRPAWAKDIARRPAGRPCRRHEIPKGSMWALPRIVTLSIQDHPPESFPTTTQTREARIALNPSGLAHGVTLK